MVFWALLHLDIVVERLKREYDLEIIVSNPSASYQVVRTDGGEAVIKSAADLGDVQKIAEIREPFVAGEIVCPKTYVGAMIQLVTQARGLPGGSRLCRPVGRPQIRGAAAQSFDGLLRSAQKSDQRLTAA